MQQAMKQWHQVNVKKPTSCNAAAKQPGEIENNIISII